LKSGTGEGTGDVEGFLALLVPLVVVQLRALLEVDGEGGSFLEAADDAGGLEEGPLFPTLGTDYIGYGAYEYTVC